MNEEASTSETYVEELIHCQPSSNLDAHSSLESRDDDRAPASRPVRPLQLVYGLSVVLFGLHVCS